eukprot:CAMPEP_0174305940 /NCGR_PEP_ID=MMETSP0810-20121108/125_1 /TAXON_ID=73025 ORGANISM="Eutreptiella gymnastica-like, Strain CCMP1594" /NCGR_SAMPLE_ID=MMETSP0810 /ASSEMBLY_ACC=CAM_ASM_000659 /LENGTH=174 /DNA_ID=CAMNT_0015412501 /DNA_START=668 /DNA_END=1192 /DNA_ORIENTATION=+
MKQGTATSPQCNFENHVLPMRVSPRKLNTAIGEKNVGVQEGPKTLKKFWTTDELELPWGWGPQSIILISTRMSTIAVCGGDVVLKGGDGAFLWSSGAGLTWGDSIQMTMFGYNKLLDPAGQSSVRTNTNQQIPRAPPPSYGQRAWRNAKRAVQQGSACWTSLSLALGAHSGPSI